MAENSPVDGKQQFRIGASVTGRDGEEGVLQRVVVDPGSRRVVDLIVSLPAPGGTRDVVLPVADVLRTDARGVLVDLSREGMAGLPDYEEVRFRSPDEPWPGLPEYTPDVVLFWAPRTAVEAFRPPSIVPEPNVEGVRNVPEGSVAIAADLDVRCGGEVVGRVDRVLVDPLEERATHLVVRHGLLPGEEHVVPVSHVRSVTDTAVDLDCHGKSLEEFPAYQE